MINVPLIAEPVFSIGSFVVTNSLINSVLVAGLLIIGSILVHSRIREVPSGLQNLVELVFETLLEFFDKVTKDRRKSLKCFPLVATFFIFILLSNWFGLLPGTGSIGVWHLGHNGEMELIPLLRPANSDLNLTLVMALVSVIGSHLLGIATLGFITHANKFVQLKTLGKAILTFNPLKIFVALIEFLVGFIEIIGEMAKVASLSLRLFGNIFAGEVLMTVISSLLAFVAPLPFMAIELLVGVVQATVFSTLTLVYMSMMMSTPHGAEAKASHGGH